MDTLNQIPGEHRESKSGLLRAVATGLKREAAWLSMFEREKKKPNQEQVLTFAKHHQVNAGEMLRICLNDKEEKIDGVDFKTR